MGSDLRGVVGGAMGACLALLAWNLGPTKAEAYPTGAVSYGANPVASWGGHETLSLTTTSATKTIMTAPSSQDFVITDVVVQGNSGVCVGDPVAILSTSGGDVLGEFHSYYALESSHHFVSGLRVPAGESMELELDMQLRSPGSMCDELIARYTISGYYAAP